ncbi:MAG TPA: chemotaxis protein CheB [Candidatus Polarisedimenticolaceae bacterium]|nr:chemotaxis protein CheB [Candidatus Polarisedimenticolaceae bacterium]
MKDRVFVIGASLSGIDTLRRLISSLPADFQAPILITQHVASHSRSMLPELLSRPDRQAIHPARCTWLRPTGTCFCAMGSSACRTGRGKTWRGPPSIRSSAAPP